MQTTADFMQKISILSQYVYIDIKLHPHGHQYYYYNRQNAKDSKNLKKTHSSTL